ncbi:MAG: hypothetical protein JJ863_37915 [Deltaproteobacteria bacterium]|nr:hypothetical protein [Deltaproteobacteria bacterium]
MRLRISLLLVGALSLGSCGEATPEPDVGFTLATLDMEPPDDLMCVSLFISEDGGSPSPLFVRNLASLDDPDGDMQPELTIDALPAAGTPFELVIEGYTMENCSGTIAYVGRSGVIRLQPGERRFLEMAFYQVQSAEALVRGELPDSPVLPTATTLPDGRVLLAGGFVDLTAGDCPTGVSSGSCFEAEATSAAWIFDPPTGKFHEVEGGMGVARGGHTATALEDGRVLVAGGAAAVRLAFVPGASGTSAAIFMEPYDSAGDPGVAHDTFEVFEPEANPEAPEDDLFRDGDPGRGAFFGSASTAGELGPLNQQRFLHAAALTGDGTVVLAGGLGMGASDTFEHFDPRRPGGYGVYDNTGSTLRVPRIAPSAVTLETSAGASQTWIIGGTVSRDNDDLAEIWTASDMVLTGVTQPATTAANFPAAPDGAMVKPDRPRFSLMRPQVAPLAGGSMAMVNGWYGPRCPTATESPYFPPDGELGVICPKSSGADFRNFTIAADDGTTVDWQASSSRFQSFGAVAVLADGRVVVTGGIEDEALITSNDLSIYRAEPADNGKPVAAGAQSLAIPRAFHAAAALRGGGILVFGGLTVTSGTTVRATTPAGEAFFL